MSITLRLALADLAHDGLRTLFSAAAIAAVVMVALILNGMALGMQDVISTAPLASNLVLVDSTFIDFSDSTISPAVIESLSAWMPDPIRLIAPVFYLKIRIEERMVTLLAGNPIYWDQVHQIQMLEGRMPAGLNEVMVGEGAISTNHWHLGQDLVIYGEPFTITGVFQAPGSTYSSLWITMAAAEQLFESKNPVQFLLLNIVPGADLEAVRQSLQQSPLIDRRYSVFLEDSYTRRNAQLVQDVYGVFNLISLLSLLAIPLSTYSMTLLTLAERARALAVLRAVGFSHVSARWFLLLRALLLGVGAFGVGWVSAYLYNFTVELRGPVIILDVLFKMKMTLEQGIFFFLITLVFALAGAYISSQRQLSSSVSELLKE